MDNFRKHKPERKGPPSVDGFIRNSRGLSRRQAKATEVTKKTEHRPQLGNFRRPDGLHAPGQGVVGFDVQKQVAGRQPFRDDQGQIAISAAPPRKPTYKSGRHWAKVFKKVSLSAVALLIISGGYLGVKAYLKSRNILKGGGGAAALQDNVDPTKLKGEGDGRVNVLMLGKGGLGHEAPDLTDTILIASIDPIQKQAALVSIPRDLYVKTPSSGSMKINAVYATAKNKVLTGKKMDNQKEKAEEAGLNAIEQSVEEVLGIPIHYHTMVDFTGFKKAIDAVGGVDVNAPAAVYEVMTIDGRRYTLDVRPGQQHFDGFRALAYARSRHTSPRGDFDRAERQRLILVGLKSKVFSLGTLSNPIKVNELLNALGDHIQTNFAQDEIKRLYDIGKGIDSSKVESIGLADPPNNYLITSNINAQSVVVPKAGLYNYKEVQNFIRNKLRDGFLQKEDAAIAVYNGTTVSGLAARTGDDLKSYGYSITTVADAPVKGNKETVLVDLTNGQKKYTKHYLEQRLKVTARTSLPPDSGINPGTANFVIILGTNEVSRLQN